MLSIFNKNKDNKPKLEGKEASVSSDELINETSETTDSTISTELSIHPEWNIPKEDFYAFQFLNMELDDLQPNQLSLSGISLMKTTDTDYQVAAFIRNSLDKAIKLEEVTLVLLDEEDNVLGRKAFNLAEAGEIPARSSRPWKFIFTHKDLFKPDLPQSGWKLAFQLNTSNQKHRLELADSWNATLSPEDLKKLETLVDDMTPPKKGEVNFLGLQATKKEETGDLHITLLIRNGSDKGINLEQIPLHVEDATGRIVATGGFKLDNLKVNANTSKPWTFIFPKSMVLVEDLDLSKWKAYPPKN